MKRFLLILTLTAILLTTGSLLAQDAAPDLSGRWRLNERLSDDMHKVMQQTMSRSRPQGGGRGQGRGRGMGGGRGPDGGGPGAGSRGGQEAPSDRMRKGADEMRKRQASLEIFQEGTELNITDGLEITRLLNTDGQPHPLWTEQGQATATARWQGDTLQVTWQNKRHPEPRTRHYQLSEDGKRLVVTEEVPLPGQKEMTTVKLVYDRQP